MQPRAESGNPVPVRGFLHGRNFRRRQDGNAASCGGLFLCLAEYDRIAGVKDSRKDLQHFGGFYDS